MVKSLVKISISVLLSLCVFSCVMAQEETSRRPSRPDNEFMDLMKGPFVSADTIGTRQAMEMKSSLGLTDKQYKKVKKLLIKREEERRKEIYSRQQQGMPEGMNNGQRPQRPQGGPGMGGHGGGRPGGGPGMGGGTPPDMGAGGPPPGMGMGGERPMRKISDSDKKNREKFMKNMKKILNEAQYEKWEKDFNTPPMPPKKENERKQ